MADKNKEAQELKGILGEINAAMQEMEAHNKRINDGFKSTKDSLSSIIDIAAQYNSYQTKNKELSADQLKNLSEKLKVEKENLKLSNCENVWVLSNPIFFEDTNVFFGPNVNEDWLNNMGLGESVSQTRLMSKSNDDYKTDAITLTTLSKTINNFFPFSNVGFVKVDIEGGEEFILEELIKHAETHHWSLWISFHLDWWEDKNIERFRDLFNNAIEVKLNSIDFNNNEYDIIEYIVNNPYASVYLKF